VWIIRPGGPGEEWRQRPWEMRGCAWARGAFPVLHRPGYFWMREVGESRGSDGGKAVGGAQDAGRAAVEDVGVDHGGGDVAVAE